MSARMMEFNSRRERVTLKGGPLSPESRHGDDRRKDAGRRDRSPDRARDRDRNRDRESDRTRDEAPGGGPGGDKGRTQEGRGEARLHGGGAGRDEGRPYGGSTKC